MSLEEFEDWSVTYAQLHEAVENRQDIHTDYLVNILIRHVVALTLAVKRLENTDHAILGALENHVEVSHEPI